ncbi:MAG TPA: hypothetical protein VF541_10480, partial [Longimicrobium sp.]
TPQGNLQPLTPTRPLSTSLAAAAADLAAGRAAVPDGEAAFTQAATFPDPNDSTTWTGDVAELDAASPTLSPAKTSQFDAGTATAEDSTQAGYGTEAEGGIDLEVFAYDTTGVETVVTSDGSAQSKTLAPSSSAAAPEGVDAPAGTTTYQSEKGARNVGFWGVCPRLAPLRVYEISAIPAAALPGGRLEYNTRHVNGGPLYDPTAVVYVYDADLRGGRLNRNPEPLVLRANAGDCVLVRLRNRLPAVLPDTDGWNTLPMIVDQFNANHVRPSSLVGLHAQLVTLDIQNSDGSQVGINLNSTVPPGKWRWYQWYAGTVYPNGRGALVARPVEFGAVNLISPDRIQHSNKGAIAGLVVEPRNSQWTVNPANRAVAVVRNSSGTQLFREQVLFYQNDVNLHFDSTAVLPVENCSGPDADAELCEGRTGIITETFAPGDPVPNLAREEDPEDSGQKGLNYRTEPLWFRKGFAPDARLGFTRNLQFADVLRGAPAQTPIFTVRPGEAVRLRVLEPGGHARNHVFVLHGHVWEQEPYADSSRVIASNPFSEWKGARDGHGPGEHFDIVPVHGAGGINHVRGDYLIRDEASFGFDGGIWAIMRVQLLKAEVDTADDPGPAPGPSCTIDPVTGATYCTGG